jgi:hypothetical protein
MAEEWDDETWQDRINEFGRFLTKGETPEGVEVGRMPKISRQAANSIIWFLQEVTGVFPDNFEQCRECGEWFNYDNEGVCRNKRPAGFFCDAHTPYGGSK